MTNNNEDNSHNKNNDNDNNNGKKDVDNKGKACDQKISKMIFYHPVICQVNPVRSRGPI